MGDTLDLKYEVLRLYRHKKNSKHDVINDTLFDPEDFNKLTYDNMIDELAYGLIQGWYSEGVVAERILKDKYDEIRDRASDITFAFKTRSIMRGDELNDI